MIFIYDSGYGKIKSVNLKPGYGFVDFEDLRDAEDAVRVSENFSFFSIMCGRSFLYLFFRIWMENECVAKKLTFSTPKDQDTRPAIVVILVVPLSETLEELTEEVDHVTDVDDLIVVIGDHTTLE